MTWPSASDDVDDAVADVQGPRRLGGVGLPRHRPVEGPVDLDGRGVELEGAHATADAVGYVGGVQQLVVQHRRDDRGDHGSPGRERCPPRCARCVPVRRSVPMWSTGAEQRISPPSDVNRRARAWVRLPAPPSGTGKPTVWPSMLISRPISPDPGASSGMSAWPALPASRRRGASPPKRWRPRSAAGVSRSRTSWRPPARGSLTSPPRAAFTGGNGVSRPPIRRPADPVPLRAQVHPGAAVTRVQVVEPRRGHVAVAVEQRPRPVGERVAEHRRRVPPGQPVLLEPEGPDRRRGGRQRVEGAEGVVHEVRVHVVVAADGSADLGLALEHEHRPARVDQVVGGDETVGAGADDDGVVRRHGRRSARKARRRRLSVLRQMIPGARSGLGHQLAGAGDGVLGHHDAGPGTLGAELHRDAGLAEQRPRLGPQSQELERLARRDLGVVVDQRRPDADRVVDPASRPRASPRRPHACGTRRPPRAGRASRRPARPTRVAGWC